MQIEVFVHYDSVSGWEHFQKKQLCRFFFASFHNGGYPFSVDHTFFLKGFLPSTDKQSGPSCLKHG